MAKRNLNRVELIGNIVRDPVLKYTPSGAAICTFSVATNHEYKTSTGEKKEEVEFHRCVSWEKLAELCGQLLVKGRKVFVEGSLKTRTVKDSNEMERSFTEIVISEMILLDSKLESNNINVE